MYNRVETKRKGIELTPNKENFIKAIFELNGAKQVVNNKDLAQELQVSAASITEMNTRLVKEHIITKFPYRGVQLTDKGIQIAYQLIRRHRLWEVFLYEKLDYPWDELHEDADLLEHISSERLIDRLDKFLNYPRVDPHGDIIPSKYGDTAKISYAPLNTYQPGDEFYVRQVADQEEFLKYLTNKGIALNKKYKLKEVEPFDGPFILTDLSNNEIIISNKASYNIFVE